MGKTFDGKAVNAAMKPVRQQTLKIAEKVSSGQKKYRNTGTMSWSTKNRHGGRSARRNASKRKQAEVLTQHVDQVKEVIQTLTPTMQNTFARMIQVEIESQRLSNYYRLVGLSAFNSNGEQIPVPEARPTDVLVNDYDARIEMARRSFQYETVRQQERVAERIRIEEELRTQRVEQELRRARLYPWSGEMAEGIWTDETEILSPREEIQEVAPGRRRVAAA